MNPTFLIFVRRHFTSRGLVGLLSVCLGAGTVSYLGHRSLARLSAEHDRNQSEMASVRQQLAEIDQALRADGSQQARNAALAQTVNARPMSQFIAELTQLLPENCWIDSVQIAPHDSKNRLRIRCADVHTLAQFLARCSTSVSQTRHTAGAQLTSKWSASNTYLTTFYHLADPTGTGWGWSGSDGLSIDVVAVTVTPPSTQPRNTDAPVAPAYSQTRSALATANLEEAR